MTGRIFRRVVAFRMSFTAMLAFSQAVGPVRGPQSPSVGGSGNDGAESCTRSPICAWGRGRNAIVHEERTPDLGFTFAYPFALPDGLTGGVAARFWQGRMKQDVSSSHHN